MLIYYIAISDMYFIISNLCIINSNNISKYQSNMIHEGVLDDSSECVNRCRPMYSLNLALK